MANPARGSGAPGRKRHTIRDVAIVLGVFFGLMIIVGLTDGPTKKAPGHTINIATHTSQAPPSTAPVPAPLHSAATTPTTTRPVATTRPTVPPTTVAPTTTLAPVTAPPTTAPPTTAAVSIPVPAGDGTYTNVSGNTIPDPVQSQTGPPTGATAQCRDGSYSFSQHHSGTCSDHGGVATWLTS